MIHDAVLPLLCVTFSQTLYCLQSSLTFDTFINPGDLCISRECFAFTGDHQGHTVTIHMCNLAEKASRQPLETHCEELMDAMLKHYDNGNSGKLMFWTPATHIPWQSQVQTQTPGSLHLVITVGDLLLLLLTAILDWLLWTEKWKLHPYIFWSKVTFKLQQLFFINVFSNLHKNIVLWSANSTNNTLDTAKSLLTAPLTAFLFKIWQEVMFCLLEALISLTLSYQEYILESLRNRSLMNDVSQKLRLAELPSTTVGSGLIAF